MKRVVLDGVLVVNVEIVPDEETEGLIVPDDCWVGPGMEWNGDDQEPAFTQVEIPPSGETE